MGILQVYLHALQTRDAAATPVRSRVDNRLKRDRAQIERARASGCTSFREIAHYLNSRGHPSARGDWSASQVLRTVRKLELIDEQAAQGVEAVDEDAVYLLIQEAKSAGYETLREIAAFLTGMGFLTPRGHPWRAVQIGRIISRYEGEGRTPAVDQGCRETARNAPVREQRGSVA